MRTPPRAKKAQEVISELEINLTYFMGTLPNELRKKVEYLKSYVDEISMEKKISEIKVAAKIKKEISEEQE